MSEKQGVTSVIEELDRHGSYASVTEGVSMRPLFRTHRDVVILKRPDRPLERFDVVLYTTSTEGKYLLHRIIRVRDSEYLIRGDNTYIIEHVKKDRVLAVLSEYNRKGRHGSVDSFSFKLYSRFWNFIYPVRFLCHKLRRLLGKIYRGLFRRKRSCSDK